MLLAFLLGIIWSVSIMLLYNAIRLDKWKNNFQAEKQAEIKQAIHDYVQRQYDDGMLSQKAINLMKIDVKNKTYNWKLWKLNNVNKLRRRGKM